MRDSLSLSRIIYLYFNLIIIKEFLFFFIIFRIDVMISRPFLSLFNLDCNHLFIFSLSHILNKEDQIEQDSPIGSHRNDKRKLESPLSWEKHKDIDTDTNTYVLAYRDNSSCYTSLVLFSIISD